MKGMEQLTHEQDYFYFRFVGDIFCHLMLGRCRLCMVYRCEAFILEIEMDISEKSGLHVCLVSPPKRW